jgi:hypothetical protein
VTATVIGATAIAAIVQLRHMRMGNQITALLSLQNEFDSKDFREAEDVVRKELGGLHEDPEFCRYCISIARRETPPPNHPYEAVRTSAILIGNTFENLGVLVKNSIVERTLFLDVYSWNVALTWERLEPLVALTRAASGERSIWDNFEYIASHVNISRRIRTRIRPASSASIRRFPRPRRSSCRPFIGRPARRKETHDGETARSRARADA